MTRTADIPLVAILRGIKPGEIDTHIPALIEAGFSMIEIPLNSPEWEISIRNAVQHYGHQAMIGAGTVLNVASVEQLSEYGCRLIVTPNTVPAVIKRATEKGMLVMPGCATITEAFTAIDAGAENLKIFPSSSFGPDYIRSLKSVIPSHVNLLAVGGVTPENLHQYLNAGCSGAGLGGSLYQAGQTLSETKNRAAEFIASYKKAMSVTA